MKKYLLNVFFISSKLNLVFSTGLRPQILTCKGISKSIRNKFFFELSTSKKPAKLFEKREHSLPYIQLPPIIIFGNAIIAMFWKACVVYGISNVFERRMNQRNIYGAVNINRAVQMATIVCTIYTLTVALGFVSLSLIVCATETARFLSDLQTTLQISLILKTSLWKVWSPTQNLLIFYRRYSVE